MGELILDPISQFSIQLANQAGELTGNVNVENPGPTVDTSGRVQYSVPTPTDAQMAQVAFAGTVLMIMHRLQDDNTVAL